MSVIETVGRYEIIEELGRGAMGVVYKAKDPTIGRTVALKTLRLDVHGLETAEMVRRFQNEARAAGVLSHPNIVTIYDAGEQDGIFYIAMEFMQGTTLHELLAEHHILPTEDVIQYSRQICKGLDYAHSHGIVHRDVKPANIMITANGTVKIMDFGIAKAGGSMTSTGQVLGTPNYMSPEQVKGRPLDGRSDLFSFGVILYEMLTGEKPFVGQNVTTIIYKIVNENPIAPRDLDVTVHPGLSAIVTRALAKSPDDRYQNGADLVRDLESYKLAGAPLHATSKITPAKLITGKLNLGKITSGKLAAMNTTRPAQPALPHEKTLVLPVKAANGNGSGATAAAPAAAPAKTPRQVRRPARQIRAPRKEVLIAAVALIVLLGSAMAGYAFMHTRSRMRQLQAQMNVQQETHQEQVLAQQKTALPAVTASKVAHDDVIAPDTTVTFVKLPKPKRAPVLLRPVKVRKATSSPNQVYTQQSELTFDSKPEGAKVEIDGWSEPNWVTPFTASHLAAGYHTIAFSKPGYLPKAEAAQSAVGKSVPIFAELSPALSTLVITSNPSGANVWVDGKDSGKITPAQLTVEKGPHRVVVRKAGFKDAAADETVAEGQTVSFSPMLLSANENIKDASNGNLLKRMFGGENNDVPEGKGVVHIRTEPEGATIIVDGRTAPKKTNVRWPADPGVYSILLEMPGYKTVQRNIRVVQGKIVSVDEILEKQ
ncbi:MAG TPA: serine/threonine-protein kinase [Candidatus Angelobacter sp.]|nr:serine/threonine-protein kinase [Candidatus Angelobacter sp.]